MPKILVAFSNDLNNLSNCDYQIQSCEKNCGKNIARSNTSQKYDKLQEDSALLLIFKKPLQTKMLLILIMTMILIIILMLK